MIAVTVMVITLYKKRDVNKQITLMTFGKGTNRSRREVKSSPKRNDDEKLY